MRVTSNKNVLAATALLALLPTTLFAKDLVIHAGRLLDGTSKQARSEVSIVIKDDSIVAVSEGFVTPAGAEVIDLSKATVLPGFVDAHVHITTLKRSGNGIAKAVTNSPLDMALAATVNARHVLESGVTSVRDTGGLSGVDFALRRAINLGEVIGPRMWVAGEAVGPTGGHNDWSTGYAEDISRRDWGAGIADGPYEVTKKVREQHKLGAGVIKILPSGGVISVGDDPKANLMTAEEIKAAVDTAHSLGLKVAAHAHGKTSIDLAVRMGVDSIEHGTYGDAESWKLMKEHGTYLVPTLLTGEILYETAKTRPESMNPSSVAKVLALGERSGQRVADAYKAGVKIAMGSDTGLGLNPREFSLLVKAGLTPIDAILASTRNSAELIGSDKIGTIQAGRYADIVAVNGDPLQDITELERVQFVMKGGVVHKQDGRVQAAPVINP